ncbi:MAG: hypothetical protein IJX57_04055 [Clostridia bacterium]|nr:hypothetical protein [Clostridia bacterium]
MSENNLYRKTPLMRWSSWNTFRTNISEEIVAINEAQATLADENDNVYAVASFLGYKENMIDAYHFNQTAYNEVGLAAGKSIADIYAQ